MRIFHKGAPYSHVMASDTEDICATKSDQYFCESKDQYEHADRENWFQSVNSTRDCREIDSVTVGVKKITSSKLLQEVE